MQPEKLIRMANQIATFCQSAPGEGQEKAVAEHINKFWEPRMRHQLLDAGPAAGLHPLVVRALPLVRRPASADKAASG